MKTFYTRYNVKPAPSNGHAATIAGAAAHFWVRDKSPERAEQRANHYIDKYNWLLIDQEQRAAPTTEELHHGKPLGLLYYRKAQEFGIAVHFLGWPIEEGAPDTMLVMPLSPDD